MCQCGFIDCKKCTTLVRKSVTGKAVHVWRRVYRLYGKSLYFLLNFAVNLKLFCFKKIKSIQIF